MGDTGQARVLIVDDSDDTREMLVIALRGSGYVVDQACDGEDALAFIMRHPPDLIVMDLSMPRLDGIGAMRLLKRHPTTASIPIIVITAHATDLHLAHARVAGAAAVLTKPFPPDLLVEEIARTLGARGRTTPEEPPTV